MELVAVDLETTGFDAALDGIIEIGAVRLHVDAAGDVSFGERFATFVDPGRRVGAQITRLTGITDNDLAGAPPERDAVSAFAAFARGATLVGHNVGFDISFLERSGLPVGAPHVDTAELASIVLPSAPSYALQRLAADAGISPGAAHRALDDALTCASVLGDLARRARALPPVVLEEARATAGLLGEATAEFFASAARGALRDAWAGAAFPSTAGVALGGRSGVVPEAAAVFGDTGPLSRSMDGYEPRAEQRELAAAVERTFRDGGVLVAEAGTGIGKSLAYLAPALACAAAGERVVVSTHTLPLQDQLLRKDLPALQRALGTDLAVAVLKGRGNYLCPRRWQVFRAAAATRDEARLVMKTLVWRTATTTGDRAELNLLGNEGALWPRVSADDESCTSRRCSATRGGCYLERARQHAARSGIVIANHALLLHDARGGSGLLPDAKNVVVDEAHRLEEVASDAFGFRLEHWRLRRDLEATLRAALVGEALRSGDEARVAIATSLRSELAAASEVAAETFGALATVLEDADRLRVTAGLRSGERWLPVEVAAERLANALGGVRAAAQRLVDHGGDEDLVADLANVVKELIGAAAAIARGVHEPRVDEVTWIASGGDGAASLYVAPTHVGQAVRRLLVDRHHATVFTSATLAVAGSLEFSSERLGVGDIAETLRLGSPFDYATQATLIVPTDISLPHDDGFADDVADLVADTAIALGGRTLALFTAHSAMRDVASRLGRVDEAGVAVLTQGLDGSRRSLLERFAAGRTLLLGTQSFWEGVDLPGDQLRCVMIVRLPFAVPDEPLVEGRAERYDDPFAQFHLPQAALRLRQGFGRLIRTKTDRGAVVLLDRRILTKDYGGTLLASLPSARLQRAPLGDVPTLVARWCADHSPLA